MRVYIAGPIAGNPNYMEQFAEAEAMLQDKSDDIFNPAKEFEKLAHWLPEPELLNVCSFAARVCDAIVMLPGWRNSRGSWIEIASAFLVGAEMMELRDGKLCQLQKSDVFNTPIWSTPELEKAMAFVEYGILFRCRHCLKYEAEMDDDNDDINDNLYDDLYDDSDGAEAD